MKHLIRRMGILSMFLFILGIILDRVLHVETVPVDLSNIVSAGVFWTILARNGVCFILLGATVLFGKIIGYVFFSINAITIGLLVGRLSLIVAILGLLPHGILEVGTFFYWESIMLSLIDTDRVDKANDTINSTARKMLVAVGLLIIAAMIETFITPFLMRVFM